MPRDPLLLEEAIEAAPRAVEIVSTRSVDELAADRLRLDALLWNLTILGEAISQLSIESTSPYAAIPWRKPIDLRNRIVHGYWSVDISVLHTTTTVDLPVFTAQLRAVLADLDEPAG